MCRIWNAMHAKLNTPEHMHLRYDFDAEGGMIISNRDYTVNVMVTFLNQLVPSYFLFEIDVRGHDTVGCHNVDDMINELNKHIEP